MVDMQLSNLKLVNRANKMVMNALNISSVDASELLKKHKSVRLAIKSFKK
jgi:N-acetylmuramic acid 6-phosphate etherase